MTIDQLDDDRLEQRLRAACHAVIPHLTDTGAFADIASDQRLDDAPTLAAVTTLTPPRTAGRARLVGVAAATLLVAGAAATWAATGHRTDANIGSASPTQPAPSAVVASTVLAPSTGSSVPCFDTDCTAVDRLPVVAGAADFYVGPESLGTAVVDQEMLDQVGIIRCIELTSDGSACQRIEGLAGVGPVTYPTDVAAPTTVPGVNTPSTTSDIEIGTTHTDVTPAGYATIWSSGPSGGIAAAPLVVRGHDGIKYHYADRTVVVWQEQPGVLVWVAVPDQLVDQLATIAEGVRRVSGPATIPYVVVVTPLARPWDTQDNNADGLVYTRIGGALHVGVDYLDGSAPIVARQNPNVDGELVIGGAAPIDAMKVRITTAGKPPVTIETVAFAGAPDARFFHANLPGGVGQVTVAWLTADGTELDTAIAQAVQADVANDSGSGPTPTTALVTSPVIDGVGTYGSMTLDDHSVVAVGVTDGGGQACLLTDWAPKVCDRLPTPVSPATIPFAHVVQSTLGQPARQVIWGVIQAGFTAVIVSDGIQTQVVLSPQNGNGLSGFAQRFESSGEGARVEIRDANGGVVQTVEISTAPTTPSP